jgi:hypothetical protein
MILSMDSVYVMEIIFLHVDREMLMLLLASI